MPLCHLSAHVPHLQCIFVKAKNTENKTDPRRSQDVQKCSRELINKFVCFCYPIKVSFGTITPVDIKGVLSKGDLLRSASVLRDTNKTMKTFYN